MTKLNLDEIEARCEAAQYDVPKAFLARIARTDIPALVERVRELEEALRQFADLHDYCHCEEMPADVPCELCTARRLLDGDGE